MSEIKKIHDTISYKLVLIFGGIGFITFGITDLLGYRGLPKEQLSDLIIALLLIMIGIISFIVFFDQREIILSKDRIEIKSYFRKRIIHKKDITGYGIGKYEVDYFGPGERIRIFSKEKSIKVFTTQYKNIEDVKEFVKGRKELSEEIAFRRESISIYLTSGLLMLMLLGWAGYSINNQAEASASEEELDALGIPVVLGDSYEIIKDEGDQITFKILEYKGYIFKVDKENTPKDMQNITKELIVFINQKESAQELANYENSNSIKQKEKPKIIHVDEIVIFDDLQVK